MKRLSHRDLETLIAALGVLYSDIALGNLPERTLSAVSRIVSSDLVAFDGFDVAAHYTQTQWHNNEDLLTPQNLETFSHVVHEHPLLSELVVKKRTDALKITDVVSQSDFEKTALYNEFFRRVGVNRQIAMVLPVAADFAISCAVNRGGRDFTEGEQALLNTIAPHLLAAIRNAYFLYNLEQMSMRLEQVINQQRIGVIALSAAGAIKFISEAARQLLESYFADERYDANDLPETVRNWARQTDCFESGEIQFPSSPLIKETANGNLQINLTYNSQTDERILMLTAKINFTADALAPLGLTQRETEILFWMTQGKTNGEIAILCNISLRTVKKHAENIYRKLGVGNRIAAVVKALEIL